MINLKQFLCVSCAAVILSSVSQAALIITPQSITLTPAAGTGANFTSININPTQDATNDVIISNGSIFGVNAINTGLDSQFSTTPVSTGVTTANQGIAYQPLSFVPTTGAYTDNAEIAIGAPINRGEWLTTNDAYLGVRIPAGGTDFRYGWVHIVYEPGSGVVTIDSVAIETDLNTAAFIPVPEPSSSLLLGLATFGLLRRRR